ncbi:MAG: 4Fe-4S binding protein [Candidatus Hodarchaeaceae archaeon]|nr:4Fe-4S binding protein [Candidatus Hodarchaeaceae archaeon]
MPRILPQVLRNLFRKPFTVKYPYVKVEPPEGYRGRLAINKERCIRCWLCIHTCPARAISVDKETKRPSIWLGRCTFCGECAEVCPTKAITMTKEFEYTTLYEK